MKCRFEDCRKEIKQGIPMIDRETLKEFIICKECYKKMKGE